MPLPRSRCPCKFALKVRPYTVSFPPHKACKDSQELDLRLCRSRLACYVKAHDRFRKTTNSHTVCSLIVRRKPLISEGKHGSMA